MNRLTHTADFTDDPFSAAMLIISDVSFYDLISLQIKEYRLNRPYTRGIRPTHPAAFSDLCSCYQTC